MNSQHPTVASTSTLKTTMTRTTEIFTIRIFVLTSINRLIPMLKMVNTLHLVLQSYSLDGRLF